MMQKTKKASPNVQCLVGGSKLQQAYKNSVGALRALLIGCAVFAAGSTSAFAQADMAGLLLNPAGNATLEEDKPLLLQADEVVYDNQNQRITAVGNVEIYYNNYTLLADRVIYDQNSSTLNAEGNVRIKEPNGAIVNAERITLTDDFKEGFIRSLRVVTTDETRIAAERAERVDASTTIFANGVFTPCKICQEHPEKAPLWRIRAGKITHKKDEKNIYYEDAALEFFGLPVAYVPYFSHPDPTVKRRSGFLMPKYQSSSELGVMIEVPYFYNLAPNYDVTFNPKFVAHQGVLWQGEWRHRMENGAYNIKLDGIKQSDPDSLEFSADRDFRGSVETQGTFQLGSWWNLGWDVTAETDDTYRRLYKIDNVVQSDRVSKVYMIGQKDRNYFEANLYHFGGLLADDNSNSESIVHPVIDYNYIFDQPILGGELSFNTNVLSLSRDEGADTNRLVAELNWRSTMIDGLGQVFTPFAKVRGDLYKVSSVVDPITNVAGNDDAFTRYNAVGGMTYSYPFVAHSAGASHIIEPVGQIIARPDTHSENDVPNEDAQSLVFDDTLLFEVDKFSGYDKIESGIRANVGLRYTMQMNNGGYIQAVAGQSYHIDGENPFSADTGLAKTRSDYVAGLYFEPLQNLSFIMQSRYDENTFEMKRTDISARGSYGPFSGSLNYASLKAQPSLGIIEDREEILADAAVKVVENWSVFGNIRYDIQSDKIINDSIGVEYSDECFVLAVSYNESFIRDRDIEPDQSVTVRVFLKHIGGTSVSSGIGDLMADSDDSKN